MYLKSIHLQGFKSFAEKVKLDFDKGITAVVGPNGSGKSNISDAARWVLGEQRIKSLRGEKMEDVIFSGTQNRKSLGYAEVNLILDNSEDEFKLDSEYSEISIKRRVYRSGESDYFINGTACRLKDLNELFMDTGVGRDGYSIIGQGRVEEILSNKSEERRMLFEEASGISKYKHRRNEALSNLEKKKQDILRLNDIISDLEEKLAPLEKQAKSAKKYLELSKELKILELNLFVLDIEKSEKELEELSSKLKTNNENILELSNDLENNEKLMHEIKAELDECEKNLDEKSQESSLQDILVEKEKNNVNIKNEQKINLEERKFRIGNQILESQKYYEEQKSDCDKNQKLLNEARSNFNNKELKLRELEKNFSEKNQEIKNLENKINENKAKHLEYISIKSEKEREFEVIKIRLEQNTEETIALINSLNNKGKERKSDENNLKQLDVLVGKSAKELEDLKQKIVSLKEEKEDSSLKLLESEKDYNSLLRDKNDKKIKLKLLAEMISEKEGFYSSVKEVLKLKDKGVKGIYGAIAELLKVPKNLEKAIEIAFGSNMQTIVVDKEEIAKSAIDYLRKNKLGRATFISLNSVRSNELFDKKILEEKHVLGLASDLVETDPAYKKVIASFLARTIIVENLDVAVELSKKYSYKHRIVSIEGDIISPAGTITGGSLKRKTFNVFSREDDYKKLTDELSKINKQVEKSLEKIEYKKNLAEEISAEIKESYKKLDDKQLEKSLNDREFEDLKKKLRMQSTEENDKVLRMKNLEDEKKFYNNELELINKDIVFFTSEIEKLENANQKYDSKLARYKEHKENDIGFLMNLRSELSALEESNLSLENNLKKTEVLLNKELENQVKFEIEISDILNDKKEKQAEIEASENKILEIKNNKIKLLEEYKLLKQDLEENKEKLKDLEEQNTDKKDFVTVLEKENFKDDFKNERLMDERKRLFDYIWNKYEITINHAREYEKTDIKYEELQKLKEGFSSEIKKLGYINLHAIDDFAQSHDRYTFLTKQKNDVLLAEEKLKSLISELSFEMEKQFEEQFKLISENFNKVFSDMFEGGRAYLKLVDENNVLESDIEIIASPPGKKLQNMMLLSGGERALTAISLLFAILKLKPSPFCILDEIEVALDDNNVGRFTKFMKKFSETTQFIIITHRKQTMESADVLYGVTMAEMGVSKIISLQLEDEVV